MSPSSVPAPQASARRTRWRIPVSPSIVLEARDRVGGRAHTIMASPDITFDLGCGWLHSADKNSFVAIAGHLDFEVDKTRPPWREQSFDAGFPLKERMDFFKAMDGFYERAEEAAKEATEPAATRRPAYCLEPGNRWNPMIDAISTYINGCELDAVSILDMDAYEDTEINWRVRRGYGALMTAYGAPLPLALNCAGDADRSFRQARADRDLTGHADRGKVIVTVPTNLIADEAIRFHPALPDESRRRARPAARACRQGDAGARRTRSLAERWQPARRHHAHRDGQPIICARSASPASKAFSAAVSRRNWKTPATARWRRKAIDEITALLGNGLSPQTKAAVGIALGA